MKTPVTRLRAALARLEKAKTHDNALAVQKANRAVTAWRTENIRLVVDNA